MVETRLHYAWEVLRNAEAGVGGMLVSGVAMEPGSVDRLGLVVARVPWAHSGCR